MGVSRTAPSRQEYASPSTPTRTRVPHPKTVISTPTSSKRKRKADEQTVAPSASTKKPRRSHPNDLTSSAVGVVDLTGDTPSPPKKRVQAQTPTDEPTPERRARRFRSHPPKSYLERAARALTQRYVLRQDPGLTRS